MQQQQQQQHPGMQIRGGSVDMNRGRGFALALLLVPPPRNYVYFWFRACDRELSCLSPGLIRKLQLNSGETF